MLWLIAQGRFSIHFGLGWRAPPLSTANKQLPSILCQFDSLVKCTNRNSSRRLGYSSFRSLSHIITPFIYVNHLCLPGDMALDR